MKYAGTVVLTLLVGIVVGFGFASQNTQKTDRDHDHTKQETKAVSEDSPYERIPTIDAYHNGEKVWFIHTDVSQKKMRKRLTEMVGFNTLLSEELGKVSAENANPIYVFTNGVEKSDTKPWGGGPFQYQIDIVEAVPKDKDYTPIHQPHLVTWKKQAEPQVLTSVQELKTAEDNGELTIKPTPVRVNAPIVKWGDQDSYLNGSARLQTATATN